MAHHLRPLTLVISAALIGVPVLAEGAAHAATAPPTAASIIAAAKSALSKQTGVHLELDSVTGSTKDVVKADFGTKEGSEVIVTGKATATVKITTGYGYISGNSLGLTSVVGLTAAEAKKVGTKWISIKAGTSQYSAVETGTTISSLSSVFPAAKGTTVTTTTENRKSVHVLKWTTAATSTTVKATDTLVIAASGARLPMKETALSASGSGVTTFSKWGEPVKVSLPVTSATITYSAVTR